jgi:predicted alpha/beta-hydrolase family hydrolase
VSIQHYAPQGAGRNSLLVLAHGAGAGQVHPFMVGYARGLSDQGLDVVTFNFPYMDAGRRMPDKAPALESCFRDAVAEARELPGVSHHALFIGGKSMGGRIATHLAAQGLDGLRGVVALGYPLHPPGKPTQLRVAHLPNVHVPLLVVQGERDVFGSPDALAPHLAQVPGSVTVHPVIGGDHGLGVRGRTADQSRSDVLAIIVDWMEKHR